jgi:hypothetical protein
LRKGTIPSLMNRSSQILRVCSQIHQDALPVSSASTTFYLEKVAHLASIARFVDCNSVQSVILRMELRETDDHLECENALGSLRLEGVASPSLQSLHIKIRLSSEPFMQTFDTGFMRTHAVFSIAPIQLSHHQLRFFLSV